MMNIGDKVYETTDKGWITAIDGDAVTITWDQGGMTTEGAADIKPSTLGHFNLWGETDY
jgi:hypothetical protein